MGESSTTKQVKGARRRTRTRRAVALTLVGAFQVQMAVASDPGAGWELSESRVVGDAPLDVFVEVQRTVGRPAFLIETAFEVTPFVASSVLMEGMVSPTDVPNDQHRRVIERTEHTAVVYTYIDLPFMLSDRELALRIVHSEDPETGIHRIEWAESNDVLPAVEGRVVRLEGAKGYWEFRPDGRGGTLATHMTQTEIGGSIPAAIGDRLMKAQAIDSVERLRDQIQRRQRTHVAGPPPPAGRGGE
jgi:hypothetical protein